MQPPKLSPRPPSSLDALERIEAKLDRLDRALGPLALLGEAPAVASTAVDAFDEHFRGDEARLDARLRGAVVLLERISRPQTLAMLQQAVDLLESLPALLATGVDAVDEAAETVGIHGRVEAAVSLLGRLTDPKALRLLEQVLGPLLDAPQAAGASAETVAREGVDLAGRVMASLRHARAQGERRVGLLGLLRALRDPGTQRALGFALDALESFGRALDSTPKSLPART
ncbi:MAG: DUF1641 domain-containing protein [Myxococcales bacterium]|nr:DUF1641 domain-containing protein [Myxococcales bacterium]